MLIKLNLIGMRINRSNQNDYNDPILKRITEDENDEGEKRILKVLVRADSQQHRWLFDENQTQFNVFDKEGNDLVYMVADNYNNFVEKIKKVFNLEIIDLENV